MSDIERFIARVRKYCADTDKSQSTVSRKLLGSGVRLRQLEAGSSLRLDTFERAQKLLTELEQQKAA